MATCIGETIENFKVGSLLGKGSFAGVYRVISLKTGLEVAIKMIDKKAMLKVGMVQRVQNEVKIHCQLKHPSILELYNYFEDRGLVWPPPIMELTCLLWALCSVLPPPRPRSLLGSSMCLCGLWSGTRVRGLGDLWCPAV
uniref:non-specific serine/threonine protein kinase n=1 Tax=Sphenodon punctatus TaxID=8508 RepID=A0A8D0HE03_SPHPU